MTENKEDFKTTLQLQRSTLDRLKKFGKKGEKYEDVLKNLMDFYESAYLRVSPGDGRD